MKSRTAVFWTGIIALGHDLHQPAFPFKGAGWRAELVPQRHDPPRVYEGREVVIRASSWLSAQRALALIQGCHQLILGDPPVFDVHLIAHNTHEPAWMVDGQRRELAEMYLSAPEYPLACAVAAKASRRRKWVYAVAKYEFSQSLYSVHHTDLEPWRSPHLAVSAFPGDHVAFAHAIIAAYSVVEDLGLTVRASATRPSRVKGEWNPPVRQDLEQRLSQRGVDISETILWTARGTKRRIENSRPLPTGEKAPWAAGIVRDTEIPVVDAIAYAEWLRSCVASHSVKDLTGGLSPYDVTNVQHVARRLLLESLGFWRWQQKAMAPAIGSTQPSEDR